MTPVASLRGIVYVTVEITLITASAVALFLALGIAGNPWYHVVRIDGGSMAPTIGPGDLIVVSGPPAHIEVGQILVMTVGDEVVTHRVVALHPDGTFVTQGDANRVDDHWDSSDVRVLGLYAATLPWFGSFLPVPYASAATFTDEVSASMSLEVGPWPTPPTPPIPTECRGMTFAQVIVGTDGDDVIHAGNGGALVFGSGGDDAISGGNGKDCLVGGDGDDTLYGANGRDVLLGGEGNDACDGGAGTDLLIDCESGPSILPRATAAATASPSTSAAPSASATASPQTTPAISGSPSASPQPSEVLPSPSASCGSDCPVETRADDSPQPGPTPLPSSPAPSVEPAASETPAPSAAPTPAPSSPVPEQPSPGAVATPSATSHAPARRRRLPNLRRAPRRCRPPRPRLRTRGRWPRPAQRPDEAAPLPRGDRHRPRRLRAEVRVARFDHLVDEIEALVERRKCALHRVDRQPLHLAETEPEGLVQGREL